MDKDMEQFSAENEQDSIIVLTDEDGNDVEFEYLDTIVYMGDEYIVILPVDDESDMVLILKIENIDGENEVYVGIDDENIVDAVFDAFKEKHSEEFNFDE